MPQETKKPVRPVIYPEFKVKKCVGERALTVQQAKDLLGWEECAWDSSQFQDYNGVWTRCVNNVQNRYLTNTWRGSLTQEILTKNWTFNGETICIGRTGLVGNGQHRLIALVMAGQEWASDDRGAYWKKTWDEEPTLETLLILGLDEDPGTLGSYDSVKPRSLADVLELSGHFYMLQGITERRSAARICDWAVKLLWHRTGAKYDAFIPRRTKSESVCFIERHLKLLLAVSHIQTHREAIAKWIGPGTAAGLFYLMGTCSSNLAEYLAADPPNEKKLDMTHWEKAKEFWTLLAQNDPILEPIRQVVRHYDADDGSLADGKERIALFIKAWNLFLKDEPLTEEKITPLKVADKDGILRLAENPTVGGIDQGGRPEKASPEEKEVQEEIAELHPAAEAELEEEEENKKARKEKIDKIIKMRKEKSQEKPSEDAQTEKLAKLRNQHPDSFLVFQSAHGYLAWGEEAEIAGKLLKIPTQMVDNLARIKFPRVKYKGISKKLMDAGYQILVIEEE